MNMMDTFLNLDRNKTYVLGVSFGVDSMVMLDQARLAGLNLIIAHVNYHKRKESDLEQALLEQYAFEHDLPLFVLDVQAPSKGNFQAWAREVRYDFFVDLIQQGHGDTIMVAHHQDDELETGLLQEKRGGWIRYWGIEPITDYQGVEVIRPLLSVTKAALYEYQQLVHLPYAEDASNQSLVYERNKIRSHLTTWIDAQKKAYLQRMKTYNDHQFSIQKRLTPFLQGFKLPLTVYQAWSEEEKRMAWWTWFASKGIHMPISDTWIERINAWLVSSKPNLVYVLGNGWNLYKAYDHFALLHDDDLRPFAYQFHTPQTLDHPLFTFVGQAYRLSPYPIVLRSITQEGVMKGVKMTKAMNRLMIDEKVPLYLRGCYPVISKGKTSIHAYPSYRKKQKNQDQEWLVFK